LTNINKDTVYRVEYNGGVDFNVNKTYFYKANKLVFAKIKLVDKKNTFYIREELYDGTVILLTNTKTSTKALKHKKETSLSLFEDGQKYLATNTQNGGSPQQNFDPTGTYEYKGKSIKVEGAVVGPYVGKIQVKRISNNKIVMNFFICKGAPSYILGSFIDTLLFTNNISIYKPSESDSTCKITFNFDKHGVKVKETTADFNSGCGFGHAVVANGYFKKTSSKQPKFIDPVTEPEIK
jgi:hypothetical protein